MAERLGPLLLWVAGLGFAGFGLACLVAPQATLGGAGVEVRGALAAIELRAFYGGLELGLAALLVAAAVTPAYRRAGLCLFLAAYGGLGLTRAAGMLVDQAATPFLWTALLVELALAALAAAAAQRPDLR